MTVATQRATADPTGSDDNTHGYIVGCRWINTDTNSEFICLSNGTGTANWQNIAAIYHDTATDLASVVLQAGQLGIATDTGKMAIGNGSTTFANLAGWGGLSNIFLIFGNYIQFGTGGSSRGTGAADLQTSRSSSSQVASGTGSFASGQNNTASGANSHASGSGVTASGSSSHAEGLNTIASGNYGSHAEGAGSLASGIYSHAEGGSTASGTYSHAEGGGGTTASGTYSHAEGFESRATAAASHAGGSYSHASKPSQYAMSGGSYFTGEIGLGQFTITPLMMATINAVQVEMTIDGKSPTGTTEPGSNRFIIQSTKSYAIKVTVSGKQQSSSNVFMGIYATYIVNVSGIITLGTVQNLMTEINPSWGGVLLQVDNTNKSLQVMVTGAASTDIRWAAVVEAVEINY